MATTLLTIGAMAQAANSTNQPKSGTTTSGGAGTQKTVTPVRKEKEKTTTKPDGTVTTVTKSKPTKKSDVSKTNTKP